MFFLEMQAFFGDGIVEDSRQCSAAKPDAKTLKKESKTQDQQKSIPEKRR